MKAEIITIGDELVRGQRTNGNARFLAALLYELGIDVLRITSVGDGVREIEGAFREAMARADLVLSTGGLGPTEDDRTLEAVAHLLGRSLAHDEDLWRHVQELFAARGRTPTPSNRSQARVPQGARVLDNPLGTAPALLMTEEETTITLLPGVPHEMRGIALESLRPLLEAAPGRRAVVTARVRTTGVPESELADRLAGFPRPECLAYLPSPEGTELVLCLGGTDRLALEAELAPLEAWICDRVSGEAYGNGRQDLVDVVAELLVARGLRVTTAESCTAGLIAGRLTDRSGSSAYIEMGFVVYSNDAKTKLLGVPRAILDRHGAVSAETASAMASGARERAGADLAVAVTGIAGPTGGSADKPVGLVFLAVADETGVAVQRQLFGNDRRNNRSRTVQAALELLRRRILDLPIPHLADREG